MAHPRGGGFEHGVGRPHRVSVVPEGSDRFQRLEDQLAALAGLVQQLVQQKAIVPAAPAPPPALEPGGAVDPPTAPVPPVVIAPVTPWGLFFFFFFLYKNPGHAEPPHAPTVRERARRLCNTT